MYCDLQKLTQSAGLKMAKNWCIITKYFEYKNVKKVDFSLSSKPKHCRVASLNSKEAFFLDFSDVIAKSLKFPLFYNIKVTNFTKKTNSAQKIIKTERCGVQKFLVLYFLRENKSLLISYELHIF